MESARAGDPRVGDVSRVPHLVRRRFLRFVGHVVHDVASELARLLLELGKALVAPHVVAADRIDVTDVVEVTRASAAPPTDAARVAGRAAAEHLVVSALQPGQAVIDFAQRRPWETDARPRATIRGRVEVKPR